MNSGASTGASKASGPSTADAAEVGKFHALSHRFWDPHGEFKPLHILNPTRAQFVAERAKLADARVLDVGCGRGLLTVAAAHRVPRGSVVGVDVWNAAALSGNRSDSVLQNARSEGVANRVEVQQGDARHLPFEEATFDVVVSNFVVHELKSRQDREQMMREVARVLKPGGHIALIDFIFTDDCVKDLTSYGIDVRRQREGLLSFWICAILNFGAVKTYQVFGTKT